MANADPMKTPELIQQFRALHRSSLVPSSSEAFSSWIPSSLVNTLAFLDPSHICRSTLDLFIPPDTSWQQQTLLTLTVTVSSTTGRLKTLNPHLIEVIWTSNLFLKREKRQTSLWETQGMQKKKRKIEAGMAAWM